VEAVSGENKCDADPFRSCDTGKYPDTLDDLVAKKYVRSIPPDPITESNLTWLVVAPEGVAQGKIFNIKSGAPGNAMDGRPYGEWW
jgi:general secretion pathway protein G